MNAVGRSIHVHRVSCGHRAGDRARPDGTGGHARGCAGERGGPWRASVVREYGLALVGRAEADENTADLRDGVRLLTESLGLLADHAQALAETRTALGVAIVRAAYRGLPEADPDLAIRLLTPGPPEDTEDPARRGARLDTAGLAFVLRGRRQGSPGDLDRGIDHYVRALRTHPRSAPGRARTTFNLAMALQERYGQRGDLSDLDAACGHLDRLIADLDPRSPEWREAQLARSECVMSRPPGRQDREEFDAGIALPGSKPRSCRPGIHFGRST
jgi:hypothetical protein